MSPRASIAWFGVLVGISLITAAAYVPDVLVKHALERDAGRGLGVDLRIRKVNLGLLDADTSIWDLDLANPKGFEAPKLMTISEAHLDLPWPALGRDPITIPEVELDGVTLHLERSLGNSNAGVILDALHRREIEADEDAGAKRIVVRSLVMKSAKTTVDVLSQTALRTRIEIPLPEIRLEDLSGDGPTPGLTPADLTATLLQALLGATLAEGDRLPPELADELRDGLADLSPLRAKVGEGTLLIGEGDDEGDADGSAADATPDAEEEAPAPGAPAAESAPPKGAAGPAKPAR